MLYRAIYAWDIQGDYPLGVLPERTECTEGETIGALHLRYLAAVHVL